MPVVRSEKQKTGNGSSKANIHAEVIIVSSDDEDRSRRSSRSATKRTTVKPSTKKKAVPIQSPEVLDITSDDETPPFHADLSVQVQSLTQVGPLWDEITRIDKNKGERALTKEREETGCRASGFKDVQSRGELMALMFSRDVLNRITSPSLI